MRAARAKRFPGRLKDRAGGFVSLSKTAVAEPYWRKSKMLPATSLQDIPAFSANGMI